MTTLTNEAPQWKVEGIARRDAALATARNLADKAKAENRPMNRTEQRKANEALDDAKKESDLISRMEALQATTDAINALQDPTATDEEVEAAKARMDSFKTPEQRARAKALEAALGGRSNVIKSGRRTVLGSAITKSLFGHPNIALQNRGFGLFDDGGENYGGRQKADIQPGRVSIARKGDSGQVVLLPEFGNGVLGLVTDLRLTLGDKYQYSRQVSRDADAAGMVPKAGTKPSAPFTFETVEDRVRQVAVLSDYLNNADLKDVTGLKDDVGEELARRVLWRIENNLINGDSGTDAESWDGVLNVSGTQAQAFNTSAVRTIRSALTKLQTVGYAAEGISIVLNAEDWEGIETAVDTNGRPVHYAQTEENVPTLYGRPVILTDKLAAGQAIVADWSYALLTIRDDMELTYSDAGGFDKNQVKFRAEMRAGFNVVQPNAFVVADLTA